MSRESPTEGRGSTERTRRTRRTRRTDLIGVSNEIWHSRISPTSTLQSMVSCKFDDSGTYLQGCVITQSAFAIDPSSTTGDAIISANQLVVLVDASTPYSRPNSLPAPLFEMTTARSENSFSVLGLQVNPSCLWLETIIPVGMMRVSSQTLLKQLTLKLSHSRFGS